MHVGDLRTAPIDGVDVFLLTRVVDTMPLSELQEIAPCRAEEVESRIHSLSALGLVEMIPPLGEERRSFVRAAIEDPDETVTLRPPPRAQSMVAEKGPVSEDALTLWPPMSQPLTLDLDDFGDPPQTGIRLKPPPSFADILDPPLQPPTRKR